MRVVDCEDQGEIGVVWDYPGPENRLGLYASLLLVNGGGSAGEFQGFPPKSPSTRTIVGWSHF